MNSKQLAKVLADVSKAFGWDVCITRDQEGVTGVLMGTRQFMETRVGPEDDVWAEKQPEMKQ